MVEMKQAQEIAAVQRADIKTGSDELNVCLWLNTKNLNSNCNDLPQPHESYVFLEFVTALFGIRSEASHIGIVPIVSLYTNIVNDRTYTYKAANGYAAKSFIFACMVTNRFYSQQIFIENKNYHS